MRILRPVVRSASNVAVVALGCVGLTVTNDLIIIAGIAGLAGAVSLLFAIVDERRSEKERSEQGRQIDDLVRAVNNMIGTRDVPLNLINLASLSGVELKRLAAEEVARLRAFDATRSRELAGFFNDPNFRLLGEIERKFAWSTEVKRMTDAHAQFSNDFFNNYRPSAKALWEELNRRLAPEQASSARISALEEPVIAGPRPAEEVACEIERLARMIPDDA